MRVIIKTCGRIWYTNLGQFRRALPRLGFAQAQMLAQRLDQLETDETDSTMSLGPEYVISLPRNARSSSAGMACTSRPSK